MTFAETIKARYPKAKVLYLNGDDEPDVSGRNGLGLELNGRRIAYQFWDTPENRRAVERKLREWLERDGTAVL